MKLFGRQRKHLKIISLQRRITIMAVQGSIIVMEIEVTLIWLIKVLLGSILPNVSRMI